MHLPMISLVTVKRPVRLLLATSVCLCGCTCGALVWRQGNFGVATTVFALGLAAVVGIGKLASP